MRDTLTWQLGNGAPTAAVILYYCWFPFTFVARIDSTVRLPNCTRMIPFWFATTCSYFATLWAYWWSRILIRIWNKCFGARFGSGFNTHAYLMHTPVCMTSSTDPKPIGRARLALHPHGPPGPICPQNFIITRVHHSQFNHKPYLSRVSKRIKTLAMPKKKFFRCMLHHKHSSAACSITNIIPLHAALQKILSNKTHINLLNHLIIILHLFFYKFIKILIANNVLFISTVCCNNVVLIDNRARSGRVGTVPVYRIHCICMVAV